LFYWPVRQQSSCHPKLQGWSPWLVICSLSRKCLLSDNVSAM
jgi:hypothetical protein